MVIFVVENNRSPDQTNIIHKLAGSGRLLNKKIMITRENEKSLRALEMLRYQANHYQAAGMGAKSQQLNAKIRRMTDEMNAGAN